MFEYVQELNYNITEKNYIKELQELFEDSELVTSSKKEEDLYTMSCNIKKIFEIMTSKSKYVLNLIKKY